MKNALEDVFMPCDEAFPDLSRKIAVQFVVQKIDKPKEIPRVLFYRSAANAPRNILESELRLRDKGPK